MNTPTPEVFIPISEKTARILENDSMTRLIIERLAKCKFVDD